MRNPFAHIPGAPTLRWSRGFAPGRLFARYSLLALAFTGLSAAAQAPSGSSAPVPSPVPAPSTVPVPSAAQPPLQTNAPSTLQPTPQQDPSPSPALPQNLALPALSPVPDHRSVPPRSGAGNGNRSIAGPPSVSALDPHVPPPNAPAPQLTHGEDTPVEPPREQVHGLTPDFLGFLGPFRRPVVPQLFPGSEARLLRLIRDGRLYLSLQDALALALENNLDVEAERYNIVIAHTDRVRAAGGGSIRGIDFGITEPPAGVGGPGSPLLNAAITNPNPTTPTVTDLTSLNATTQAQNNLNELGTGFSYSLGPNIPLFDPELIGTSGFFRRSNSVTLGDLTGATGTGTTTGTGGTGTSGQTGTTAQPLDFVALNAGYVQGFRTGGQLEAIVNNDPTVIYGSNGELNPFSSPSTTVAFTQPLLRGRGSNVSLRFLRIARTDEKISRLLFEQQALETVYGISRLYFDLVSLGENVQVQQESLRAATKQRQDDQDQVAEGTLAPIELTRAQALESSTRFALTQSQGLYKTEEIILRNQLLRTASPAFTAMFSEIVPTDVITVPTELEPLNVPTLIQQALARRPDLAQAHLQVQTGQIQAQASRNNALPQLNVYANYQQRGSSEQPYEVTGTPGTGQAAVPQELSLGGLRVSTIYQAGVQLTLPLRNRVAESDAARDTVQVRQVQARTEKLAQNVRQDVETAVVALQTADASYRAAVNSRNYQAQLLDADRDRLSVGQGTDLIVVQDEAFLAQARSTEIAARSNYMKARIELDHALGDLLDRNHISLDDAIRGQLPNP
jgi:outer membrane protein